MRQLRPILAGAATSMMVGLTWFLTEPRPPSNVCTGAETSQGLCQPVYFTGRGDMSPTLLIVGFVVGAVVYMVGVKVQSHLRGDVVRRPKPEVEQSGSCAEP